MHTMQKTRAGTTFLSRWGPAILMMVLIFFFSAIPAKDIPSFGKFDFSIKKLGHMLGYAILAPAYLRGIGKKGSLEIAMAWALTLLFAFTDETHQAFVPGRTSSIFDVGIDGLGAIAGLSPYILLTLRTLNRNYRLPPKN
jgi:VanZ family protein